MCLGFRLTSSVAPAVDAATSIADGAVSFSAADMQRMSFLAACVKETLRLFPPAPFTARVATQDVTVNGQSIAEGDLCFMDHYSTHLHEDFWPAYQVRRLLVQYVCNGVPKAKMTKKGCGSRQGSPENSRPGFCVCHESPKNLVVCASHEEAFCMPWLFRV